MKPQDFVKEFSRMCGNYKHRNIDNGCVGFPMEENDCWQGAVLDVNRPENFAKAYDIVAKWSDEHPVKTRQSKFLKMFPNAYLETITRLLPCSLDRTLKPFRCAKYGYLSITCRCDRCRDDYWNEEVTDND